MPPELSGSFVSIGLSLCAVPWINTCHKGDSSSSIAPWFQNAECSIRRLFIDLDPGTNRRTLPSSRHPAVRSSMPQAQQCIVPRTGNIVVIVYNTREHVKLKSSSISAPRSRCMAAYTITCFSALDKVLHAAELGRRSFQSLSRPQRH